MTFYRLFVCVCVCRGVLDGLLESYPWRGPLSLDFKPFTIQLQGTSAPITSHFQPVFFFFFLSLSLKSDVHFNRRLRVAGQQRQDSPPSLLFFIPPAVLLLAALLPGCRPAHPRSPSLRQGLRRLAQLPTAQQSLLLAGSRPSERPSPAVPAGRLPTPLGAAREEASSLQGPMFTRVSGELILPPPPPWPPQPSGAVSLPSSLRHYGPLLSLPLQLPPEPPTRSYFPARQTSRRHHKLSAAPVSVAPDHQPLPLTAGPHV